ncbi:hypothetical protein [Kushneria aurantia]|uniref:Uncharacterized protein n=1 Tax=Kushneria aurantia TaxID=504092 RepID=A0ABV6G4M0_9GAMM|nr:hypothetical protein [Kushneria aurantia]
MSDINTAAMDREALEKTADDLGVSFQKNTGDDTLRKRIDDTLGNATPSNRDGPSPPEAPREKRYKVIVQASDSDQQPVQVFVNGRAYVMKRGEECEVPASVVEVLNHAVQHVYDPTTMQERRVLAYPFSAREA